jgi:choline dehydrogenase
MRGRRRATCRNGDIRLFEEDRDASELRPAQSNRGYSGPIRLSYGTLQHPISKAFIESAKSTGLPESNGFNGPSQIGAGYRTHHRGWQTLGAFKFRSRKGRSNLTIMANCQVRRLALEGTRVRGVVIERRT